MKIRLGIKASSKGARYVIYTLIYNMFSYILVYTIGFPRTMLYIGDMLTIITFIFALMKQKKKVTIPDVVLIMFLCMILNLFSSILNNENVLLIVWGIRNSWRYFIYFYSCYVFLKIEDIDYIMSIIWKIYYISIPLVTIERFFVSYPPTTIIGDMIGGIFWNYPGCNLPFNAILCVCIADICWEFFNNKINILKFALVCVAGLYMSALAELKVFIVEFIFIVLVLAILQKVNWKKIIVLVIGSLIFSQAISFFVAINGSGSYDYSAIFSVQGFMDYLTRDSGYNGDGDLNRLTGVSIIAQSIFKNDLIHILFGLGLGNAEYTNFFTSVFYNQYSRLNYQWFHMIWMFIETGIIGVIAYLSIFIKSLIEAFKVKSSDKYVAISKILILIMFILFVYNISLRSESAGYLLFTILSIPYIYKRNERRKEDYK